MESREINLHIKWAGKSSLPICKMGAGKVEMTDTSKSTQPMPSQPPNEAGQLYFFTEEQLDHVGEPRSCTIYYRRIPRWRSLLRKRSSMN